MVEIPEGLMAYFHNETICEAVNLLLSKKRPPLPDNVEWNDVPDFFRSVRAARQIQGDYAILLHEIWNAVWQPLPEPWYAYEPHEQSGEGVLDPGIIWDQNFALRYFEIEERELYCELIVSAGIDGGVQIGFYLTKGEEAALSSRIKGWDREGDVFWSPAGLVELASSIALNPLKKFAQEAIEIINNSTGK